MKGIVFTVSTLCALCAVPASAADWFDRVSDRFDLIEQQASGQIVLHVNNGGIAVSVPGRTSTCSATTVLITPPASREKDWLAMVMGSILSGGALTVYGDCNASAWQINATRIFVDYGS